MKAVTIRGCGVWIGDDDTVWFRPPDGEWVAVDTVCIDYFEWSNGDRASISAHGPGFSFYL